MKRHKVVLDISVHLVHHDSPTFSNVSLELPPVAHLHPSIHAILTKSLGETPVVREYLDVFPDDLLGMPPDRAIEFKIELQPDAAPVYRRPYPMVPNEVAELKT
jgi:hypothetical protein